jgi:hypothetical protein
MEPIQFTARPYTEEVTPERRDYFPPYHTHQLRESLE